MSEKLFGSKPHCSACGSVLTFTPHGYKCGNGCVGGTVASLRDGRNVQKLLAAVLPKKKGKGIQGLAKLAVAVTRNAEKLQGCRVHDFSIPIDQFTGKKLEVGTTDCQWRCANCGGLCGGQDKRWYEEGLRHGARLPRIFNP